LGGIDRWPTVNTSSRGSGDNRLDIAPIIGVVWHAIMKTSIEIAVEKSNSMFYKALELGSIEEMDGVWLHMDWVSCVHPGWDLVLGWERVRHTWAEMFDGGQKMRISSDNVNVRVCGDIVWLTCIENITVFQEDTFASMQAVATNIFLGQTDGYKLIHHHASPIPAIIAEPESNTIQ
jgi:ketosteroid isomerase-like protein